MTKNLLKENWRLFDQHELRLALGEYIGGPGQFQDREKNPNKFSLPQSGAECKIILTLNSGKITSIEQGPAFERVEWDSIVEKIECAISTGPKVIGRNLSFSTFRVTGSWLGQKSGIQILAPPIDAPRANMEIAEHPFLLEFPINESNISSITNYRWKINHRRTTLILNLFLNGHTSSPLSRPEQRWAQVEKNDGTQETRWVTCSYFAKFGNTIIENLSPPTEPELLEVNPEEYYAGHGHDGRPLQIPSDLDNSLSLYRNLSNENRSKFDRAAFWMDLASRQWHVSISSSFASLVSAVEALTERGEIHSTKCPLCNTITNRHSPGPTKNFINFLETYAPGKSNKKRCNEMYSLRSGILHGSNLMRLDEDNYFGLDPHWLGQHELTNELWLLTKASLRQWLKTRT